MMHLPFADRLEAGRLLARELASRPIAGLQNGDAVVLALTRGGVPVGFEVADRLCLPLDIIVVRKLGVPWQPEVAMGAIARGTRILDENLIRQLGISAEDLDETIAFEQAEMRRREEVYRGGVPAIDLDGRPAILIDDGLATGNTMLAAVRQIRTLNPSSVIVGVPVGPREACDRLRSEVDHVVCLATPHLFCAVGEWYRDFEQVSDAEVRKLLAESRRQFRSHKAAAAAG
jgi:putative phosphoribosyl transferase